MKDRLLSFRYLDPDAQLMHTMLSLVSEPLFLCLLLHPPPHHLLFLPLLTSLVLKGYILDILPGMFSQPQEYSEYNSSVGFNLSYFY